MKRLIQTFFTLSRTERNGTFVIAFISFSLLVCKMLLSWAYPARPPAWTLAYLDSLPAWKDSLVVKSEFKSWSVSRNAWHFPPVAFDPDTLSPEGWIKMGLSEKQAGAICKFRGAIGGFHSWEDFCRIKVVDQEFFGQIEAKLIFKEKGAKGEGGSPAWEKEKAPVSYPVIEINLCSAGELDTLPGIGLKTAERIIKFRDKLGGFYSLGQLSEVFGFTGENREKALPWMRCNGEIIRMPLNYANRETLSAHPYLGKYWAAVILTDRNRNGYYRAVQDLQTREVIPDSVFQKINPYLEVK